MALVAALGAATPALLGLAGCAPRPAPSRSVTLVAHPGRFPTVLAAAAAEDSIDWWSGPSPDQDACTESFAATELARFLPAALGLDPSRVRIASATRLPDSGDVIVVGAGAVRALGLRPGLPGGAAPLAPDAFHLGARRSRGRTLVTVEGASRTGTLAGTYALLERLGVRCYDLGDANAVMPARAARLPETLDLRESPAFETRGFWAWEPRGSRDFFLWMARNRMNLWTAAEPSAPFLEKLGIRLSAGGHEIESAFLDPNGRAPGETRTRFAAHPEWYGLEDGKRKPGISGESGLNFCTSNRAAVAELARGLVASLGTGAMRRADVVQLWPLDGGRWCTCDSCRALGEPVDRWLRVAAAVKAEIGAARKDGRLARDVLLLSPAYLETSAPPTRDAPASLATPGSAVAFFPYFRCYAHALGDGACTIVNRPIAARFLGWAEGHERPYRGDLAIGEYYNVSWTKSLPVVIPHVMATDLGDYARFGVKHFFTMHAPTRLWGTWTLEHALLARLLRDPRLDVDSLIADFCAREYGPAGEDLRAFYHAQELATANLVALQHAVGSLGFGGSPRLLDPRVPIFQLRHLTDEPPPGVTDSSSSLTGIEASLRAARLALDAGRARRVEERVAARLAEVDARFRYGDAMIRFWITLIRAAESGRAGRAPEFRAQMERADSLATTLARVTDLVQVAASHANAKDGLAASGTAGVYRKLLEHARAVAPR